MLDGSEHTFHGVTFVSSFDRSSTVDRFMLRKPPDLIAMYLELAPRFQGANIVELGIAAGGSTALLALLTAPRKIVACELAAEPVAALGELIDKLHLPVSPHYGVDQSDRALLESIAAREFADESIDLVIDDASHRYDATKASYDVLWPQVRSGGTYIIEDWACDYAYERGIKAALADPASPHRAGILERIASGDRPKALHEFTSELVAACGRSEDVAAVSINHHWTTLTKA